MKEWTMETSLRDTTSAMLITIYNLLEGRQVYDLEYLFGFRIERPVFPWCSAALNHIINKVHLLVSEKIRGYFYIACKDVNMKLLEGCHRCVFNSICPLISPSNESVNKLARSLALYIVTQNQKSHQEALEHTGSLIYAIEFLGSEPVNKKPI